MKASWAAGCILFLVGGHPLHGQFLDELKPRLGEGKIVELGELPSEPGSVRDGGGGRLLCARLEEVEFVDGEGGVVDVPERRGLDRKLGAWLGKALDEDGLSALVDVVLGHYEANGYPVVEVWVPEQAMETGRLELRLAEGRIGEVLLEPGRYFSGRVLEKRILFEPGEVVTERGLERQLANLDGSSFRDVEMYASPGQGAGETDLLYRIQDRRPWRLFGGYENSGTEVTGEDRWMIGVEAGNLWGLDHRLVGQYTAGNEIDRYSGFSAAYEVPLSWGHRVVIDGTVADVEVPVDLLGLPIEVETRAWEIGVRYIAPVIGFWGDEHVFSGGLEFGSTSYRFSNRGSVVSKTGTESLRLAGRYAGRRGDGSGAWIWGGQIEWNLGGASGLNSDEAYESVRAGASDDVVSGGWSMERQQRLPLGFVVLGNVNAHYSSSRLLPDQMLTLGGAGRVRGYDEREFFGDEGVWGTLELRSPAVDGFGRWWSPLSGDVVQGVGFFDWGEIGPIDGEDHELRSAGAGIRYQLSERVDLRFDYGWRLDGDGSRGHLGVLVRW